MHFCRHFLPFCFLEFFDVDHFKVLIEFVTILLLFYVSVFWPQSMCEFSSLTRDWTCTPCIGRQNLNNWMITWEVPATFLVYYVSGISWVWCHWNTKIRNNFFWNFLEIISFLKFHFCLLSYLRKSYTHDWMGE